MSKLNGTLITLNGLYDFAVDAGAVGTVTIGMYLPKFAVVRSFFTSTITTVTSGGSATIAFGYSGSTQAFQTTTAIASYTANTSLNGVDLMANPLVLTDFQSIIMTIGTAAITAGKIKMSISYVTFDI
jgi:hypothetical protein